MDSRLLYNPLAVFKRDEGLLIALVVVALLTGVAIWGGVHLDGVLDLHITPQRPSPVLLALESLIDWLSLALLLFAGAKMFGGSGGLAKYVAAAGLARYPMILAAAIVSRQLLGAAMLKAVSVKTDVIIVHPKDIVTPALIIGALLILALSAWSIVISVFGFKEASRLHGGKVAAGYVIGIVLAETVSKLALLLIIR